MLEALPNPFPKILNYDTLSIKPLSPWFEGIGLESTSVILNLEWKIVLLTHYLGVVVIAVVCASLLRCSERQCARVVRRRCEKLFNYEFWLRLMIELFLELVIISLISVTQVSFLINLRYPLHLSYSMALSQSSFLSSQLSLL